MGFFGWMIVGLAVLWFVGYGWDSAYHDMKERTEREPQEDQQMELLGLIIGVLFGGCGVRDSEFGANRYWEDPDFDPATYWTESASEKDK